MAMQERLNFFLDRKNADWLEEQYVADGLRKAERIRALITLARTKPSIADQAAAVAAAERTERRRRGAGSSP